MKKEIWKDIPGFEGIYQASSHGKIKSLKRVVFRHQTPLQLKEKILSQRISNKGYCRCALFKDGIRKEFFTHRIIAWVFMGLDISDKTSIIDHKDFDTTNNYLSNLRIVNIRKNNQHKKNNVNGCYSSLFVGVYRRSDNKKWCANIGYNKKTVYLGSFDNEIDAAKRYNQECLSIGELPVNKFK